MILCLLSPLLNKAIGAHPWRELVVSLVQLSQSFCWVGGGLIYTVGDLYNQTYITPLGNVLLKILSMIAFVVVGATVILFVAFVLDRLRLLLMKPIWMVYDRLSVRKP